MATDFAHIAANVNCVQQRIVRAAARAGRRAEDVTLVAVSKVFPPAAIRAAYDAGLRHFGENRVQEWESKFEKLSGVEATWHLVGHLQSNKARRAAKLFHAVDSVDSLPLARRLDVAAAELARTLRVLIEVKLDPEPAKTGADPESLEWLAGSVLTLPHLDLQGLMAIPPMLDDPEQVRPYFRRLRDLRDDVAHRLGRPLPVLSMGMTHDFEAAIEEGATEVRIGTAIFGTRVTAP